MPELPNQFQIPRAEATPFGDGDQLDFHAATSNLLDLGDARDLVQTNQPSPETTSIPEFGPKEAMRLDEWIEWVRTAYGDENWDLKD